MAVRNPSAQSRTDQQDGCAEFSALRDARPGDGMLYRCFATNRRRAECRHGEYRSRSSFCSLRVTMRSFTAVPLACVRFGGDRIDRRESGCRDCCLCLRYSRCLLACAEAGLGCTCVLASATGVGALCPDFLKSGRNLLRLNLEFRAVRQDSSARVSSSERPSWRA